MLFENEIRLEQFQLQAHRPQLGALEKGNVLLGQRVIGKGRFDRLGDLRHGSGAS
jgi:hypothetical protein